MLYAALAILFFCVQNLANKEFGRRMQARLPGLALVNALALTLAAAVLACLGGATAVPPGAFATAAGFGVIFVVTIILIAVCMTLGPLGPTALIINMSMAIAVVLGLLVWGETMTWPKAAGIACMGMVLLLTGMGSGARGGTGGRRWLLLSITTMVCNGLLGVLQRVWTVYYAETDVLALSFWAFVVGALVSWALTLVFAARRVPLAPWTRAPRTLCTLALLLGGGTLGGNVMLTYALKNLPGTLVFPLVQGSVPLLMAVASARVYREGWTRAGAFAIVFGIAGIVLLSVFGG